MSFQYSTTRSFESTICPGVTVVLRKTNEKRRSELMRATAGLVEKERQILNRLQEVQNRKIPDLDDDGKQKIDPVSCEGMTKYSNTEDLQEALDIVQELTDFRTLESYQEFLRWGLAKIEGLEVDGEQIVTVGDLLSHEMPDGFVEEILNVIQGRVEIPGESKKNSELLTPSSLPEQPTTQVMTATPAETN